MAEDKNNAMLIIYRGAMAISTGAVLWLATTVVEHQEDHAQSDLDVAIALINLTNAVESIKKDTNDRYTATDADRDFRLIKSNIDSLRASTNNRLSAIERSLK